MPDLRFEMLLRPALLLALVLGAPRPAMAQHDCVPYPPTEEGATLGGSWADTEEVDVYEFTVPDEPGGGIVTVELHTPAPAVPWLNLSSEPSGDVFSAGGAILTNPHEIVVVFEAAGGQTYSAELYQVLEAPADQHPWPYDLSWSYESRVDCYEPNDGIPTAWPEPSSTARTIPLELVIEAYNLAGLMSSGIAPGDPRNYDWFHFSLATFTEVSIGTLHVPADQSVKLRLYEDDGTVDAEGPNPPPGGLSMIGPRLLSPGNYYIAVLPIVRGFSNVRTSAGDPYPDHFDDPYRLVVTASPLDVECGFQPIFCDGFESGDLGAWTP